MSIVSIGNYRLTSTLGTGSFGKVKLAEHLITGHKVAVKILNRKKIKSLKMGHKIKREIQILKLFRHPHIIKLYEVIETQSDILLIMEYVSGGELFEYIVQNGRLNENQARSFFQQIICAVEYCHKHMIVHRDLKPENLLLDTVNMCVKIADFGLSNVIEFGDFLKTSCGSPNYAAPEVISGKLYAGPEVDVWSCGVILYALLCARLPFDDEYIPSLFKKIRGGIYNPPDTCSDACRELISRMLTVDPLKRITIREIREECEWFKVNLPTYLQRPPRDIQSISIENVDEEILDELTLALEGRTEEALNRDEIRLKLLEPVVPGAEVNELVVAYHLLYDARYAEYTIPQSPPNEERDGSLKSLSMLATSPPINLRVEQPFFSDEIDMVRSNLSSTTSTPVPAVRSGGNDGGDVDGVTGSSVDRRRGGLGGLRNVIEGPKASKGGEDEEDEEMDVTNDDGEDQVFARKKMWYLGKMSKKPWQEVMNEVYRVLKLLNFEWKVINPFQLRCRRIEQDGKSTKMGLQLFKVSEFRLLLDVKMVGDGSLYGFYVVAGRFLEFLKI